MKGSDTLEDVAKGVITSCQNATLTASLGLTTLPAASIVYAGGGSGGGQAAMLANPPTQRIAPMSRPLNGAVACPGGSATTQGVLDARAEQLLIGLDGIAVVGANQNHGDSLFDDGVGVAAGCPDQIVGPVTLNFTTDCTADGCVAGATAGTFTYTFGSWKEVLAMLYGGQNNITAQAQLLAAAADGKHRNPARINCASPVRKALADQWGTLFESNVANCGHGAVAGNCIKLKHAFRRGDLSGTSDTFVTLAGMVAIPAFTTLVSATNLQACVNPATATASAFCNAGTAPMNKGDSDYLDLDPIRRISDSGAAGTSRVGLEQVAQGYVAPSNPPAVAGVDTRPDPTTVLVELPEAGGPTRQNWGPDACNSATWLAAQQANITQRKGLGLVLPIEIPTNFGDEGVAYWSPSAVAGQAPTLCDAGQFAPSLPDALVGGQAGVCPDGKTWPCLFPVHKNPDNTITFNCLTAAAVPAKAPVRDERFYNILVVNSLGKYVKDNYLNPSITLPAARQNRTVAGFFRLHASQLTNLGGNPTIAGTPGTSVCKQFTSTDQIGCLVKANPCSIGYAGREAVDKLPSALNSFAYQLGIATTDAKPPTDTNIYALLDPLNAAYYPMSRKLFVNHWNDPALPVPASAANEDILYSCFKNDTLTSPIVTNFHFLKVPTGPTVDNVCPNNR
jgi:ABC-type phosphate transport system substrate-binding protein